VCDYPPEPPRVFTSRATVSTLPDQTTVIIHWVSWQSVCAICC